MTQVEARKAIVAGGSIGRFGRCPDRSLEDITTDVVRDALQAARVRPDDIQAAFVGNAFGGVITGQESILAQILLAPAGIVGVPMHTVKNACSSGSDAVHLAWSSVTHGQYDCVLALGAEKLTHPQRERSFAALASATDRAPSSDGRSVFVDINAAKARAYMEAYGAVPQHFAAVASKNRLHASLNERAAERDVLSIAQVLGDRVVAAPLTRSMCAGIVDGAACLILMSESHARRYGFGHAPRIVASACASGMPQGSPQGNATRRAARAAYEQAGIDPRDIQVAEVHDPTAPQELFDLEDLMLCAPGEAIRLVEARDTTIGGRIPVNTSGGLTARGHPVGATGVAQILEIHEQLTACAGRRQVEGAKVGVAQMAGGLIGSDSAIAIVHILAM